MWNALFRVSLCKLPFLAVCGLLVVATCSPISAQTKDKDAPDKDQVKKDKEPVKREQLEAPQLLKKTATLVRSGYTRPGNPCDLLKDGNLYPLVLEDSYKGRYVGATVYFAVYERSEFAVEGDIFGTGYAGIDELFKEGRSTSARYSPGFDTSARFLYVYQIVNDRGLDQIKDLAGRVLRTEDIVSATVKLLVEPQEITSWGHFSNTAFAARVGERDLRGKAILAADGKTQIVQMTAFSSSPAILAALPYHEYLTLSSAMSLHDLNNYFTLQSSTLNLRNSAYYKELLDLKGKGGTLAAWQDNMLAAAKGGMEPAYVQIVPAAYLPAAPGFYSAGGNAWARSDVLAVGQNLARGYLKVDWMGDQVVKLGEHSVVFGFTSNLPPAEEVVRVISASKEVAAGQVAVDAGAVAFIDGNGVGVGPGQVLGVGTVLTPVGSEGVGVGAGFWFSGPVGGFGGGVGGIGGGIGGAGGGLGGLGGSPTGGGGGGGSNGGGGQEQKQNGQQSGTQTQTVTITNTLTNTQTQFQNQRQSQSQSQSQSQRHGHNHVPSHVVPEPATIALGLLGLPVLYFAVRRRKCAPSPAPNS